MATQFDDSAFENSTGFDDSVFNRVGLPAQSQSEAAFNGAIQGATLGTAPYFGALRGGVPGSPGYKTTLESEKAKYASAAQQWPLTNLAGNVAGSLPTMVAGEKVISSAFPTLGNIGKTAILSGGTGAISGAASGNDLMDAAVKSAAGAGVGVLTGTVGNVGGATVKQLPKWAAQLMPTATNVLKPTAKIATDIQQDAETAALKSAEQYWPGISTKESYTAPQSQYLTNQEHAYIKQQVPAYTVAAPPTPDFPTLSPAPGDIQRGLVQQEVDNPGFLNKNYPDYMTNIPRTVVEAGAGAGIGYGIDTLTGGGNTALSMIGGALGLPGISTTKIAKTLTAPVTDWLSGLEANKSLGVLNKVAPQTVPYQMNNGSTVMGPNLDAMLVNAGRPMGSFTNPLPYAGSMTVPSAMLTNQITQNTTAPAPGSIIPQPGDRLQMLINEFSNNQ